MRLTSTVYGEKIAVFEVETERGSFQMRNRRDCDVNQSSIVWVNQKDFLKLWQNERHGVHEDLSKGNPMTWKNDDKFSYAEAGFMASKKDLENPVPLAWINCAEEEYSVPIYKKRLFFVQKTIGYETSRIVTISFTDGITRTIWLMSFGCDEFPVQCSNTDANILFKSAGVKHIQPIKLGDWLN